MFDWKGVYGVYPPMVGCTEKSIPSRNCEAIEKKLKERNIPIQYVARHHIFGIDYYELVMKKDAEKCVFDEDIAEIFDIPKEWVGFVSNHPKIICIREDKFNCKFCDEKGLLDFGDFNFLDNWCFPKKIREQLERKKVHCRDNPVCKTNKDLVFLNSSKSSDIIADALNIPSNAVTDVSCECDCYTHIINVSKVMLDESD